MSGPLDMSLDDLIKNSKKSGSRNNRGRGRGSGPGPDRRFPNRASNRPAPYATTKAAYTAWQHAVFGDQGAAFGAPVGRGSIETGTKLYISNLDYGVSNEDIKRPLCNGRDYLNGIDPEELFSEVGDLKRYSIHYDRSGRSKGTAEVVFSQQPDAIAAVKRYNGVQLDGKPMEIEIVGTNIVTPAVPTAANGIFGNSNGVPRGGRGRFGALGWRRGGGVSRGSGRGRGRGGRGRGERVSAEDLDADLEKYHAETMQTN